MSQPSLLLASTSPRRRELLAEAGYQFELLAPSELAECGVCSGESPPEFVARMAYQKAADVATHVEKPLVIVACDTVAEWGGQILGKPRDVDHARWMLQTLRGRQHHVYSGVCLWRVPHDEPAVRVAKTTLLMAELTDPAIEDYLDSNLWEGKAGAFGWQDRPEWLSIIEGSPTNVVGLPMELLTEMLTEYGVTPVR